VAVVGYVADAQYRMFEVHDRGRTINRAMGRLYTVDLPGYRGHALWIDCLRTVHGDPVTEANRLLCLKHALRKAQAVGAPLFSSDPLVIRAAAEMQKAALPRSETRFFIDEGHGRHHYWETQARPRQDDPCWRQRVSDSAGPRPIVGADGRFEVTVHDGTHYVVLPTPSTS
jgi:hypothetical protein